MRRWGRGTRKTRQPAGRARPADEDVGGAPLAGEARDGVGDVVARLDEQRGAEHRRQLAQRAELALLVGVRLASGGRHPEDVELGAEALGRAPGAAHEPLGARIGLDECEEALADRLREVGGQRVLARADGLGHQALGLDLLGHLAQRDLAERREVLDPEEAVQRGIDALGLVDLARAQAREQRLGAEVDEDDLVGPAEHRVGDGLAHAGSAELGDLVVERLEVLDVDGGEHVDAGVEQVLDVLVALLVLEARRVGVRQLVDQRHLRRASQDGGEVHVGQVGPAVGHAPLGDDRDARRRGRGLLAPVRLEQADDDVAPGLLLCVPLEQHPVGLADPRRHAEVDRVVAAARPRGLVCLQVARLSGRDHDRRG